MKIEKFTETTVVFTSSVHDFIRTSDSSLAKVIEWADAHPVVWRIVRETRSKAFGKNSSFYYGYLQKSDLCCAILGRAEAFKKELELPDGAFHGWKARFTMKHYEDKGFRGGFFQQHDGTYYRGCSCCDYTPATREEVITRFLFWCDSSACRYETDDIHIDKKSVRKPSKLVVV